MSNIVLNASNISNSNNSQLTYRFPRDIELKNHEVVLSHMNMFFSWFNVSAANNNNKFSYNWPWSTTGTTVFDVTIEDGYYDPLMIYEILLLKMVENGHYLVLTSDPDNIVVFIEMSINPTYYSIEFQFSSIGKYMSIGGSEYLKTVAPADNVGDDVLCQTPTGWTVPTGTSYEAPSIIIPDTNFGKLLGFAVGTVAATVPAITTINTRYTVPAPMPAQMKPQSAFIITCSLVSNIMSSPSNVIASFSVPGSATIGDMISPNISEIWSHVQPGTYSEVRIQILDQNYVPLAVIDPSMLFVLSIREKASSRLAPPQRW